jgi:hypothetical protein
MTTAQESPGSHGRGCFLARAGMTTAARCPICNSEAAVIDRGLFDGIGCFRVSGTVLAQGKGAHPQTQRSPALLRSAERNLRRRPAAPALNRGRIQRALDRCFFFHGPVVDGGTIHRFCQEWRHQVAGRRPGALDRLSVYRVLVAIAEPVGRATTRGRPWLWRLRDTDTERQE